jgi:exosortase
VCFLLLGLALLMGLQPYAAGYGDYRKTLLEELLMRWKDPSWQHGAVAPLLAGWLIWLRRREWLSGPWQRSWLGAGVVAVAMLFYYAGYKAHQFYLGGLSIQLFLLGTIGLWAGWRKLPLAIFPSLILGFMWPLIFLEDSLAFQLRQLMVSCTSTLLNAVGMPTLRDGTALISAATPGHEMGTLFSLNIDGPCSGMRSLFALLLVGALVAYFSQRQLWRRLLVFFSAFPLAIVSNMVRLLLLVFGSRAFGQAFAVGDQESEVSFFHFAAGLAVYLVAFLGLLTFSKLLDRLLPEVKTSLFKAAPTAAPVRKVSWAALLTPVLLSGLAVAACRLAPEIQAGHEAGVLTQLPAQLGPYSSTDMPPDSSEKQLLPEDTVLVKKQYFTPKEAAERDILNFTLVLAGAERRSIHRPEVCLTGQGWTLLESKVVPVQISANQTLEVTDLLLEKTVTPDQGQAKQLRAHYVYWFIGTDLSTPSNAMRIWLTSWDNITRNVNHRWAYASVTSVITEGTPPEESGERQRDTATSLQVATEFIRQIVPQFQKAFLHDAK